MFRLIYCGFMLFTCELTLTCAAEVEFRAQTIDPEPGKVCYAVAAADVDGDGTIDAVVVTENRVLWYAAPDWKMHEMLVGVTVSDNVCIAAHDIDSDGHVDFAIGAGWPRSGGSIGWISRSPSGKVTDAWNYTPIGEEPWTHRMRFGDVLGTGTPQLVVSALNGNSGQDAHLLAFEIPTDPTKDRWKRTVIADDTQRMHNHWCLPAETILGAGTHATDVTLVAAQDGVSLITEATDVEGVQKRELLTAAQGAVANGGAGEVKPGKLADGSALLATIEPMHGNAAVVYEFGSGLAEPASRRIVLDDRLGQGHAVWCADVDRDGSDEVVIGHREPGTGIPAGPGIYLFDRRDGRWFKQVIDDGGMACEDLTVADFNGDGRLDILAGGRATHNVKIYFQETAAE